MYFFNFPWKQNRYLVYSSYKVLKSDFFNDISLQLTPKDSLFFRFLRHRVGFLLSSLKRQNIDVPNQAADYLGIIKEETIILFEYSKGKPVWVWRKNNGNWEKEAFIGRQLISEYSVKEFQSKYSIMRSILQSHWSDVTANLLNIHGDFTHFNILIDEKNKVHLIDKKSSNHSKIFDFFYFYSYLIQAVERNTTLSKTDLNIIVSDIQKIIKDVCIYNSVNEMNDDLDNMRIPISHGLEDATKRKEEFLNFLLK